MMNIKTKGIMKKEIAKLKRKRIHKNYKCTFEKDGKFDNFGKFEFWGNLMMNNSIKFIILKNTCSAIF